jgi:translation initiation factor 2 subunit 2
MTAALAQRKKRRPVADQEPVAAPTQTSEFNYGEMLGRAYTILQEKNPELQTKKTRTLQPPNVGRIGRRIVWTNFATTCQALARPEEHVQAYCLAELGCEGSVDGKHQMTLKGKYVSKDLEILLKKYIGEYVTCRMCRNTDTTLNRDSVTRLSFLQCDNCGSRRSVAPIRQGYHAVNRADRRAAKEAAKA